MTSVSTTGVSHNYNMVSLNYDLCIFFNMILIGFRINGHYQHKRFILPKDKFNTQVAMTT